MTMAERIKVHAEIETADRQHREKYYVYTYWDGVGGGKRWILATSEKEARKRLRQFLNRYHPFRKYSIQLENVTPA